MTSSIANVLGGHVHYTVTGSGPEVILCLHGNSSSSRAFSDLAERLAAGRTLISLDFPGHGRSDGAAKYKHLYSFQGLADFTVQFVEAARLRPTTIIGHSMGGHVASQALLRLPSVKRLILLSSPPIAGAEGLQRFFRATAPTASIFAAHLSPAAAMDLARAFTSPALDAQRTQELQADILATDSTFRAELGRSLGEGTIVDELSLLLGLPAIDLLLIGGEADSFIDDGYYAWIASRLRLPQDDYHVLAGVGHYPHVESPPATAAVIADFLSRCRSADAGTRLPGASGRASGGGAIA
jgi:pimeloyl-ACP methyl ester carboxylesterase